MEGVPHRNWRSLYEQVESNTEKSEREHVWKEIALEWLDSLNDINRVESTIIHELTHVNVEHLPLPRWLDEGLALNMQVAMGFRRPVTLDEEESEKHFSFWTEEEIQNFWDGSSFKKPGDSSELSYDLAEIMLSMILQNLREKRALCCFR